MGRQVKSVRVLRINNGSYGIWEEDILSFDLSGTVHRLPARPPWFSGVSSVNGRTAYLYDLGTCLGLPPLARRDASPVLVMRDDDHIEGFIVEGGGETIEVEESRIHRLPQYLHYPCLTAIVVREDRIIPIIDIRTVFKTLGRNIQQTDNSTLVCNSANYPCGKDPALRLITVNNEVFGLPDEFVESIDGLPAHITVLPSSPAALKGIVHRRGAIRSIVDPAVRLELHTSPSWSVVLYLKENGPGILAGSEKGIISPEGSLALPESASSSLLRQVVILDGQIIPVFDTNALISDQEIETNGRTYSRASDFHEQFRIKPLEVMEFTSAGIPLGIPCSEVDDDIPVRSMRTIPLSHPLLKGVTEFDGRILPVFDLARFFDRSTQDGKEERFILMKNGDFEAFLYTGSVPVRRFISQDDQRDFPLNLPHRYIYGCYLSVNTVRLILDVTTIIEHSYDLARHGDLVLLMEGLLHDRADQRPEIDARRDGAPETSAVERTGPAIDTDETDAWSERLVERTEAERGDRTEYGGEPESVGSVAKGEDMGESHVHRDVGSGHGMTQKDREKDSLGRETYETIHAGGDSHPEEGAIGTSSACFPSRGRGETEVTGESRPEQKRGLFTAQGKTGKWAAYHHLSAVLIYIRRKMKAVTGLFITVLSLMIVLYTTRSCEVTIPEQKADTVPEAAHVMNGDIPDLSDLPSAGNEEPGEQKKPTILLELEERSGKISMRMVPAPPIHTHVYVVKKGDTLWDIAERFTGNPFAYHSIAGDSEIQNPDLIFPGQKVLILIK